MFCSLSWWWLQAGAHICQVWLWCLVGWVGGRGVFDHWHSSDLEEHGDKQKQTGFHFTHCFHACMLSHVRLHDSMDCSPSGSSVCGTFPGKILEWVAVPFSTGSSRLRDRARVSCIGWRVSPLSNQGSPIIVLSFSKTTCCLRSLWGKTPTAPPLVPHDTGH